MTKRRALRIFSALTFLLALGAAQMAANVSRAQPEVQATAFTIQSTTTPDTYFVQKVVDGDTLDVYINGATTRLRLIGMDTPEVVDSRKPVQCFGPEASAEAHTLLENQWVRLEYDAVTGKTDTYGRVLAYVFLPDGSLYNELMIRRGFAHEYDYKNQKYKYRARFQTAQKSARAEGLGFWSPSTCSGNTTKPVGAL